MQIASDQIGACAGKTTGAVTHYFTDREDVVPAALLLVDGSTRHRFTTAAPTPVDAPLATLPNHLESRRGWRVWNAFSDYASLLESLLTQCRAPPQHGSKHQPR